MNLKTLILIIVTGLLLHSCKKEESTAPNNTTSSSHWSTSVSPPPEKLVRYYYFKPGTYWVFRDSATGIKNTLCVTASKVDTLFVPHFNYGEIQISLHQSDSTYNSDWKWALSAYMIRLDYKCSYRRDDTAILFWDYPWSKTLNGLSVNGNTYDSVAEIHDRYAGTSYGNNDVIYMSDSIGFIKMRIHNFPTRVWELVEYNIVR